SAGTQAILLSEHGGIDAGPVTVLGGFFGAEAANTLEADHGVLLIGGNANLLQASGAINLTAGGDARLTALIAGSVQASAGQDLNLGVGRIAGAANLAADGNIIINTLQAGGTKLEAGSGVQFTSITNTANDTDIQAKNGNIQGVTLDSTGNVAFT